MESPDVATRRLDARAEEGAEQEDLLVGRILDGRYRLIRRLGRGGMGAVYEAEHLSLESRVAIKVLQASLSTDEKYRKRFLREARAASAIESLNVVRSTDFGATADGLLYFAMELMEGQDLEQHLAGGARLDWSRFEPVLRQVLGAVGAAHKRGVIHRDIKPSNCFLCKADAWPPLVKVLDFGIAKINANHTDGEGPVATLETLTATNELFGTIAYMAPELIEGQPADMRSDVYALGVLMFRVLTGKLPFTSPNVYKVLQQHVSAPVPSLRALVPEIPAAVESVVFRAMAKRPEHRYQSVAGLEVALAGAREGVIEPSAAALSGHTQAVPRGAVPAGPLQNEDASPIGDPTTGAPVPDTGGVTRRIDDPGSLASIRIRAPRFSPLAMLGLAVVVASGTAAVVASMVGSSRPESSDSAQADAPPAASEPVLDSVTPRERAVPEPEPEALAAAPRLTAAPQPTPAADPSSVPQTAVEPTPATSKPPTTPRKGRRQAPDPGKPAQPQTIDDVAGARCPDAIGDRFTIEGVLNEQGKYIDVEVTGAGTTKATRDCIAAFIRTRSFGKGRSMEPHTVRLAPR